MNNNDYWKKRFEQLEAAQNQKGLDAYSDIEQLYRRAEREIEGKINTWYQRFASNNGVSMAEARRMLSARELAELKWDVKDYIKYGKDNAISESWVKELENASARFHISRLEALKLQTQQSLEVMFGNQLDSIDAAMKRLYLDGYYHTAYELQNGFRIGWDIAGLDQRQIEKVISKPWAVDGKNFSERIWGNKQKLIPEVHKELTRNILLGQDPKKAIDRIAKKMNASKSNAGRLIMTEKAYFSSAAQKDCFHDLGVEQYEIVATLDSHTSDICRSLDGKVFPMKDYQPGITAPPFHVWCRSTTVPHFDEDYGQIGERAARDEKTGEIYYVPDDMDYQEWKKTFVDGGGKSKLNFYKKDGTAHWTRKGTSGKIDFMDITDEWKKAKGTKGSTIERQEYIANGVKYKVDGKHVILHPTEQERKVARILCEKYGKTVEFVPQVLFPQGVQTPDYMIDGDRFDLKSPTGKGKNVIYGLIAKKRRQADNFIVDISDCPLSVEEIEKQIESLYISPRVGFLERIILIKGMEVLKVYARNKKSRS